SKGLVPLGAGDPSVGRSRRLRGAEHRPGRAQGAAKAQGDVMKQRLLVLLVLLSASTACGTRVEGGSTAGDRRRSQTAAASASSEALSGTPSGTPTGSSAVTHSWDAAAGASSGTAPVEAGAVAPGR